VPPVQIPSTSSLMTGYYDLKSITTLVLCQVPTKHGFNSFPFDWCQRPTQQLLAPSVCGVDGRRQARVQATCRCFPPDWHPLRGQRGRTWTPPPVHGNLAQVALADSTDPGCRGSRSPQAASLPNSCCGVRVRFARARASWGTRPRCCRGHSCVAPAAAGVICGPTL